MTFEDPFGTSAVVGVSLVPGPCVASNAVTLQTKALAPELHVVARVQFPSLPSTVAVVVDLPENILLQKIASGFCASVIEAQCDVVANHMVIGAPNHGWVIPS